MVAEDNDLAPRATDSGSGAGAGVVGSTFERFGLRNRDVMTSTVAALLIVAFGPFFHSFFWTPRVLVLLAALPFGLYELGRLARGRDRPAVAALALTLWALIIGLYSDAPWASVLGSIGRWESVLFLAAALGCWALGRQLSHAGRRLLGRVFIAACLANGIVGLSQVMFDISYEPLAIETSAPSGFSTNPVYYGATMAGAAGWCIWQYAFGRSGPRSRWTVAAVSLSVFGVSLSGSRVALMACVVLIGAAIAITRSSAITAVDPGCCRRIVGRDAPATE